jgi:hypothetical protein
MPPFNRSGINSKKRAWPLRKLGKNCGSELVRLFNNSFSRSRRRESAPARTKVKLMIFASELDKCVEQTMENRILNDRESCIHERHQGSNFRLRALLEPQACPSLDLRLTQLWRFD